MRRQFMIITAAVSVLAVAACSAGSSSSSSPAVPAAAHKAKADGSAACEHRKAAGDLLVRDSIPGTPALTSGIGGEWKWDSTAGKCLDAVAWTLKTAGTADGECTTIAKASSNRGYNLDASPAPRLRKVIASAGPGC